MNTKKLFTISVALIVSLWLVWCANQQQTTSTSTPTNSPMLSQAQNSTNQNSENTWSSTSVEVITLTSDSINYNGERWWNRWNDTISTSITVDKSGIVSSVAVNTQTWNPKSEMYQNSFKKAISSYVVWKPLKEISITKVGGASNTSEAFQQALDSIKTQYTW